MTSTMKLALLILCLIIHDSVGSTLVPVTSENGTYSTYLFTQKAFEIIEAQDPGQVQKQLNGCIQYNSSMW